MAWRRCVFRASAHANVRPYRFVCGSALTFFVLQHPSPASASLIAAVMLTSAAAMEDVFDGEDARCPSQRLTTSLLEVAPSPRDGVG